MLLNKARYSAQVQISKHASKQYKSGIGETVVGGGDGGVTLLKISATHSKKSSDAGLSSLLSMI